MYNPPPPPKRQRRGVTMGRSKKGTNTTNTDNSKNKIKAVMFIPYTKHSELAHRMRDSEMKMESMTFYKLKIVERGGTKLVDMLHKANPWAGEDCERSGCLLCETKKHEGKKNRQDCRMRNCVYQTYCITCKERQDQDLEKRHEGKNTSKKEMEMEKNKIKRYIYIGETNRSVFERGLEHQNDVVACKTSSHILRHLLDQHEEEEQEWDNIRFGMKIIKNTRTAFERQILESVEIQKARTQKILNNKSEYNRCAIPRLTAKLGERELQNWREEDKEELEREASIEEKIRIRKKERAKKRAEASRRMEPGQPRKKRMKIDEEEGMGQELVRRGEEMKMITPKIPIKRKVMKEGKENGSPKKKRRQNYDIKRYISCKKWREEGTRVNLEREKEGNDILLGMGRRLDTTSPAVTVTVKDTAKTEERTEKERK